MEKYEEVKRSRREIFVNNFLGGISWSLGATLGLSLIIALLTLIAKELPLIPVIGKFVSGIVDFVLKNNSHFH